MYGRPTERRAEPSADNRAEYICPALPGRWGIPPIRLGSPENPDRIHLGYDYNAPAGTQVRAIADG